MNVALLMGSNKTLYLKEKNISKYAYVAAAEHVAVVLGLAKNNPKNQYYVIGLCSDYSRMSEEEKNKLPQNLHFTIQEKFRIKGDELEDNEAIYKKLSAMVEEFKKIKIDYGIMCASFTSGHLPGIMLKKDKKSIGKLLISQKRSAMYSNYLLNELKFPYIVWNADDRFVKIKTNSIIHPESACIGFENCTYEVNLYKDLSLESQKSDNTTKFKIPIIYNGIDTLMLCTPNFKKMKRPGFKDKYGMLLFLNPSPNYDRYKDLKETILPYYDEYFVKIYGDWYSKKPETICDPRFHGKKPQDETMKDLQHAKYSVVLASHYSKKSTPCSAKFWECLYHRVIPFLHSMYGKQEWKEYHNIPEFLWFKDGEELNKKIKFLESHPDAYKDLWEKLEKVIKPEYFHFKHINDLMKETVEKYCKVKW